jgi:uncharacterized protein involved in exopolysaccharide biosynthesis
MKIADVTRTIRERRKLFLRALAVAAVLGAVAAFFLESRFVATSSVLMVSETSPSATTVPADGATKPILSTDLPYLATTPAVVEALARDLAIPDDMMSLEKLKHHIKATLSTPPSPLVQSPGAILVLAFKGSSPEQAVNGANDLAREVTSFYRDRATVRFRLLIANLKGQLTARRRVISGIEARLQRLSAAHPFLGDKFEETSLGAQYDKLQAQQAELAATARSDAAAAAIVDQRPGEVTLAARHDLFEADPTLKTLRQQYAHDVGQLSLAKAQYNGNYPGLPELEHTVAADRRAVDRQLAALQHEQPVAGSIAFANALDETNRAQSIAVSDTAKLHALDSVLNTMQRRLDASRDAVAEFDDLQRQHDVEATAYAALEARLTDATGSAAEAASIGSTTVLDQADYAKPVPYTIPLVRVGLVLLLSLAVAVGVVLLAERLDRRLRTITFIEKTYGIPVVATLN